MVWLNHFFIESFKTVQREITPLWGEKSSPPFLLAGNIGRPKLLCRPPRRDMSSPVRRARTTDNRPPPSLSAFCILLTAGCVIGLWPVPRWDVILV
jgi:hypothetical protein